MAKTRVWDYSGLCKCVSLSCGYIKNKSVDVKRWKEKDEEEAKERRREEAWKTKLVIDKYQRMQLSCKHFKHFSTQDWINMTVSSFQSGETFQEDIHDSNFTEKIQPGFVNSPTCLCKPSWKSHFWGSSRFRLMAAGPPGRKKGITWLTKCATSQQLIKNTNVWK